MKKSISIIVFIFMLALTFGLMGCGSSGSAQTVKNGDTVNIDYAGTLNGVAFDGGTAQGYDLVIGSNTFIPGFEAQIIGMKVGAVKDIHVTFPNPYLNAPQLAGKPVVFKVTLNSINGQK